MRELKVRIKNFALARVETTVVLLTKPFSKAADLQTYSRCGYYLLGLIIVTLTLLLWWQGILTTPLSESNVVFRAIYQTLSEKIDLTIPDSLVPLAFFFPLVWLVLLLFWPGARNKLGELTANIFFWLLNKSIGIGEWCIEHRWYSLLLIGFLSAGIAVLTTLHVQQLMNARTIQNNFGAWLDSVDDFIEGNPVNKPEPVAYERVREAWRPEFTTLLARNDGTTHPAICLHEMLDDLYLEKSNRTWLEVLQNKVEGLRRASGKCVRTTGSEPADPGSTRARALVNLFMARINARLADDAEDQHYSNYQDLVQSRDLFTTVANLDYGKADYGRRYLADAYNGQGTIYSNALTAYMNPSPLKPEQLKNLRSLCGNPAQCASRSLRAYQTAGQDWEGCSYRGKRQRNNIADLLSRIGLHYDKLARSLNSGPLHEWTRTPVTLADQIEQHIRLLMACNSKEPFLSIYPITAAQGLAVAANLRRKSNLDGNAQLVAAGRYLRLANSFEPDNVPGWDCSYFCFTVSGRDVDSAFRDAIESGADGLPDAKLVVDMIGSKCQ